MEHINWGNLKIEKISSDGIISFIDKTKEEKHLKGYIYDSLVYRYIRARDQMAEYEFIKDSKKEHDKAFYQRQANRDIMRFIEILNEAIGEHD